MILALVLTVLLQTSAEPTVAVIPDPSKPTVIMTITEAEQQLKITTDPAMRHALVLALGSSSARAKEMIVCEGHQPLCQTIRGRRLPLQGNF